VDLFANGLPILLGRGFGRARAEALEEKFIDSFAGFSLEILPDELPNVLAGQAVAIALELLVHELSEVRGNRDVHRGMLHAQSVRHWQILSRSAR